MSDVMRTCRRTGCRWPAVASLSFRYETREVWLEGLADEAHPAVYDLCPHHAGTMTVPRGWQLIDRQTLTAPPREPAGRDLPGVEPGRAKPDAEAAARKPDAEAAGKPGGRQDAAAAPNRYAVLVADLPRLAAAHAATRRAPTASPSAEPVPVASRELSPHLPPLADADAAAGSRPEVPEEVEGQLAMPVVADSGAAR